MSESWKPWLVRRFRHVARPVEVVHDLVEVPVDGVAVTAYVLGGETEHGPVLYFVRLEAPASADDQLAGQLLADQRWAGALVIKPYPVLFDSADVGPYVGVHPAEFETGPDGRRRLRPGRRCRAEQIGRALGADLPIWVNGTTTVATARAALADPGRTVPLPDNTNWPRNEATLDLAARAALPESYPLAWAALTADYAGRLRTTLEGQERLADRGRGWYLAARPRLPRQPPLLAGAAPPRSRGAPAAAEVISLEAAAGAMDRDDPRADVYTQAAARLSHLMFQDVLAEIADGRPHTPHLDRVRAARPIPVTASWAGPVVETWLRSLTPVPDLPSVLRQHRIAALRKHTPPGEVHEAYLDRGGRYVLVLAGSRMCAEGHRDPAVATTWTAETVLAADRPIPDGPAGPLLALTPEADGGVRADPVPASPVDGGPLTFEFGGDHPQAVRHVMRLLLSLALDAQDADFATRPFVFDTLTDQAGLTLWPALTAPADKLRLPWPTVQASAAADVEEVRRMLASDAPPIHRYFAIVDGDKFWQVVRQTATADGFTTDQHIDSDGAWTHSNILAEIGRGKRYDDYRQLKQDEVDDHVETIRARWADRSRR